MTILRRAFTFAIGFWGGCAFAGFMLGLGRFG